MGALLDLEDLAAAYGDRHLFSGLTLTVGPDDVVGIVGPNGSGKSTLLRIIAGELAADGGRLRVTPPGARIGYLPQEPQAVVGESIAEHIARRTGVAEARRALDAASDALAAGESTAADHYTEALDVFLASGAAHLDERYEQLAPRLGLDLTPTTSMASLSGGQAARIGLAVLLLSSFDVYLLDEPTNNLDADGLDLIEEFVAQVDAPVLVVSHDREFLSRSVTLVVEIDRSLERVITYGGGYDAYVEERSTRRAHAPDDSERPAPLRDEPAARARMQRAWMAKGVRNARRKAPDNDKVARKFRGETSEKQAAKARQTQRMLERLDVVAEPRKEWQLQFDIGGAARSGDVVATARGALVQRGTFRLGPVDLHIDIFDRVAVTGDNGAGKTTLIDLLLGRITPDAGAVSLGPGVIIGSIDQYRAAFEAEGDLAAVFASFVPELSDADVRTLLAKFGLGARQVHRSAKSLSPGERTRGAMALLQARGVNFLVLDEPTNHLDLPAIEQLEDALDRFDGTLLLVTHDRRMLDAVRLTRRLHVEAGQVSEVVS
jgi:ATPase subunit of ABC transporter with duplicated ATPase domains